MSLFKGNKNSHNSHNNMSLFKGNKNFARSSADLMTSLRTVMNSKIHRATVTEADINYVGSITIDLDLIEAANIAEWEQISVLNITNGSRLQTYVIPAKRGSKKICINGAAAHLTHPGDIIILVTYKTISSCTIKNHHPTIIYVNSDNEIIDECDAHKL